MKSDGGPPISAFRDLLLLVDQGGVAAAAKELGISQPAMSRRLKVFHEPGAKGTPLLETLGKRLKLTPAGDAVLPAVRELVRQYDRLLDHLDDRHKAPQVVCIGLGILSAQAYLPRVLAQIGQGAVDFEIETQLARGRDRILGVAQGHFDMAVVTHDPLQIESMAVVSQSTECELEVERLCSQAFCAIAGRTSEGDGMLRDVPKGETIPLAVLAECPLVGLDPQSGIRRRIERQARALDVRLRFDTAASVGGWAAAKAFARQGLGVAIVPLTVLVPGDRESLTIRRLPPEISVEHYLIHRRKALTEAQLKAKQAFQEAARDHERAVLELWEGQI